MSFSTLPIPEKLPEMLTESQCKMIILLGIVGVNYADGADEVVSYKVEDGIIKGVFRDRERLFDFSADPANEEWEYQLTPESLEKVLAGKI